VSIRCVYLILLVPLLAGCATSEIEIRRLPPDRPAAQAIEAKRRAESLAALEASPAAVPAATEGEPPLEPVTPMDAPSLDTYDPWEPSNRLTYRFNARLDEAVFLPVADHYRRVPAAVRRGAHNFFANIAGIGSAANYALQWRPVAAFHSLARLAVNSTLGLGGLFDVASKLKLRDQPTGFSDTLSRWGMHPGPYLVIPFLGPSTLRDGIGRLVDYATLYVANPLGFYRGTGSWAVEAVDLVDRRANTDFRYYSSGSPFEYDAVRFLYVRARLIEDAERVSPQRGEPTDPLLPAGK
jgi:phospholipid-binding lipoprotein MlaA